MPHDLGENDWTALLRRIKNGTCTPFLGAGACYGVLPLGNEVAKSWAKQYGYPLQDSDDLARVAQFLAVGIDAMFPKEEIAQRFKEAPSPQFTEDDEPHRVLASLPLPVYMTTNYDDFMERALQAVDRTPHPELCPWNKLVSRRPSVRADREFEPTVQNPIVFHLHGHTDVPESLVLTEDDYLDFLVSLSKDKAQLLKPRIQDAMTGSSLLFLGYGIRDWDFRVLFRGLVEYLEISTSRSHVSVQLVPGEGPLSPDESQKTQEYLERYFEKLDIRVYWGTCRQFAAELSKRWSDFERAN